MTSPSRIRRIRISRSTRDIQIAGTHRPGCPLGEVGGPAVDVRPRGTIYTALEILPISHTGSMLVWLLFHVDAVHLLVLSVVLPLRLS
jgi:hypothetical protein